LRTHHPDSEFICLTFYFSAPFATPASNARASWYGFSGTPSVMFDGQLSSVGGQASGSMYATYEPLVSGELTRTSPMSLNAGYVVNGSQVSVTANIVLDQATSGTNRKVSFYVTQDQLHGHPNMVVAKLPDEPFTLTTPGQSVSIQRTFTMDPSWNEASLNIVALVQNGGTREIYQAGQALANYAGSLVIDCVPNGVEAAWTLSGPNLTTSGNGDQAINVFAPGAYTVTWTNVPYWTSPSSPQTLTLTQGGAVTFVGTYTNGPFNTITTAPLGDVGTGEAISLVDIDNDGDLDIHMTGGAGADKLLRNDGANVFTALVGSPLTASVGSNGAAWADVNGDGNLDVYLARTNLANQIYLGDGTGAFTLATTFGDATTDASNSASWIDYNLDGQLDISVANAGTANTLLENRGEIAPGMFLFAPAAGSFGNTGVSSCIIWGDGDLNGRPDPFLVNQFTGNVLFENLPIGFSDLTPGQGMGDLGNGQGAAFGDYDNDGDLDLYVANDGQADILYRCTGPFQYTQVMGTHLADPGNGRGVIWADFDNDTNLDLYVTRFNMTDLLLLGDGLGGFTRVAVGPDEAIIGSNALACGDMNNDGRTDVVITRTGAANVMFENGLTNANHWAGLHLTGAGLNTGAIGARVVLTAGGISQTRFISPGSGFLSCSAANPHFGLGNATTITQIDIYWPDGTHQIVGPQSVDQVIAITEGQNPVSGVGDTTVPQRTVLGAAYPNPFNPRTTISFTLATAGRARLEVFTVNGRHLRTLVDGDLTAGTHLISWDGTDDGGRAVASGTYLYRLHTGAGFVDSGSMVLVK